MVRPPGDFSLGSASRTSSCCPGAYGQRSASEVIAATGGEGARGVNGVLAAAGVSTTAAPQAAASSLAASTPGVTSDDGPAAAAAAAAVEEGKGVTAPSPRGELSRARRCASDASVALMPRRMPRESIAPHSACDSARTAYSIHSRCGADASGHIAILAALLSSGST